jgi:hypothetical protein
VTFVNAFAPPSIVALPKKIFRRRFAGLSFKILVPAVLPSSCALCS